MADTSIIRNRRKIEATLHNARLLSKYSLSQLAWRHQPGKHHRLRSWADGRMTSRNPASLNATESRRDSGLTIRPSAQLRSRWCYRVDAATPVATTSISTGAERCAAWLQSFGDCE